MSKSPIHVPGSTARKWVWIVGRGKRGTHIVAFKPLFEASYTIRISSAFGTEKYEVYDWTPSTKQMY
jgi:hypothetical protein